MSVTVRQIDPQCKPAQSLTLPQLETIVAPQVIQEVLSECHAWECRERKLNMQAIIYLIMALALSPQCSTREVYRRLLEGLRVVAVDGTLENLPDTDANRTVFPYHCLDELARSPFPQARCVLLMAATWSRSLATVIIGRVRR